MVHLAQAHPLTGFEFCTVFSARTLHDLLFADMFFSHWKNRQLEKKRDARVRGTVDVPPETIFGNDGTEQHVLSTYSPEQLTLVSELSNFKFDFVEALVNRSKLAGADVTLPKRFTEVWQTTASRDTLIMQMFPWERK